MKIKIFLICFFVMLIFLSVGVLAETCTNIGEIKDGKYCDVSGEYILLKDIGLSCLNDYECSIESCVDGICQSKYAPIVEQTTWIEDIWNLIKGYECTPGEDGCYGDDDSYFRLCGVNGVWEEKGQVDGECGYSDGDGEGDGDGDNGNGGGGSISIKIYSPRNITYGFRAIPLEVADLHKKARYWRYSLNGGGKITFVPNTTISANAGINLLTVYASEYASFSGEKSKLVQFKFIESVVMPYCGDGNCDSDESASTCPDDCSDHYCGDGKCDGDESSFNCSEDCPAKKRTDYTWLFVIIVILLLSAIAFVTFLIIRKLKEQKKKGSGAIKKTPPKKFPPKHFPRPLNRLNQPPRKIMPGRRL